ncbi:hypothetical protein OR16_39009 [Cupriavidus basilensis OR16]|uniref:Surface antigen domain-containing protein n=1 Tax=Cupriavidus basilensis OR16 TaxID=1127483 RepID=H1SH93_9BURK|nr:hypothetical protein [Cupriavidus basilensis]EHP38084.1 hypothetical protein OR16_39009 [Cupriavidus basilensis OR16]
MTQHPLLRTALVCAALLAPAAPAFAYLDTFIHGTVIGTMSQKESASLVQSVGKVLNEGTDGTMASWTSPAESKRKPIEGQLTPLRSKTDKGQACRQLKMELKRADQEDNWTGWFCKQNDGRWRSRKVADD